MLTPSTQGRGALRSCSMPLLRLVFALAFLAFLAEGVRSTWRAWRERGRVVVEDAVVGAPYWIERVDGRPVRRVEQGWFVTYVPYALVEPGTHALTLRPRGDPSDTSLGRMTAALDVVLEPGARYRLATRAGAPVLERAAR